jgi:hypothetical protein
MGKRPYGGMAPGQLIQHITSRRGLSVNTSCPPPLRKFILRCTSAKVITLEERMVQIDERPLAHVCGPSANGYLCLSVVEGRGLRILFLNL